MLNKFDEHTRLAAANLQSNRDHQKVIKWLKEQYIEIARAGMKLSADDQAVRCHQGAFKVLGDLINNLESAWDIEEAIRRKKL